MEQKPSTGKTKAEVRETRLKAALKANMARRKAQAKARANQTDGAPGQSDKTKE